jgi:hypothetical protein
MRMDVDFGSYAAARWHLVVRTLVLLGVPPGRAAELARQALARRRAEWSHLDAFDDLDAELYRAVLDLRRRDPTAWWASPPFDEDLWTEIEPALDRLTPPHREWLVLRHVAELPEAYIAAVVGESRPADRSGVPTGEELRDVARLVPVPPPDTEEVAALAAGLRRRRRRRAVLATAAVLAVAAAVGLVAVTHDDAGDEAAIRELAPVSVERVGTVAAVGWYADGRLHLKDAVLDLPSLRAVGVIDDGAVYLDDRGDLVQVNEQGQRLLLAPIGVDGTFAVSDEDGVVAWLPEAEDAELVVRNLTMRAELGRVRVHGAGRVIAVDAGSVFFRDDEGDQELVLQTGEVVPQNTSNLLDVAAKVRVVQETPDTIRVVQPLFDITYTWPGTGAQLSEEGLFVITRVDGDLTMYDTRSGHEVPVDVGADATVLAAEFGPANTITYLLLDRTTSPGTVVVRTCSQQLVFLPSGERAPKCAQDVVGPYGADAVMLRLAR